ncbi:LysR family transcriptional regulator [Nocardia sp. NPDC057227]|uniref:LysR family transcriptional regulator n=1 Tax=Nocardia sp. NPDC057227 TaxID=3346056 RepID=UPI0036333A8A
MERYEIEAFLTLAEELHFRRTSERLGLAQGRVSQTIKRLEQRIGVPLFERTSRRVALTPVGAQLRDDLAPAYREVKAAYARAVAYARGVDGVLRVGFSGQWSADLVLAAGALLRERYPCATVAPQEVPLDDPLGGLRAGELDLQLSEFPVDEPDLVTGPVVFAEPAALLVPSRHPLARRDSVSVEELAAVTLVTVAGAVPAYWIDHRYPPRTPSGLPIARGAAAPGFSEVQSLVAAGAGVSIAALRSAEYNARPGIVYVPLRDAPPIEYGLTWPVGRETVRVRALIEAVMLKAGRPVVAAAVPARRPPG